MTRSVSLAAAALLFVAGATAAQDTRPVFFEVKVPAAATIEIDGHKTTSTGAVRRFQTPPVAAGKEYSYTIKAVAGGKEVVKKVKVSPDREVMIDLTADFTSTAKPLPPAVPPDEQPKGPTKPGFVTIMEDGRLWVFKEGAKELDAYKKDKELAKHVVRPGVGPGGITLKAPDAETIAAFVTSVDGYETIVEDGRLWVFKKGAKELDAYKKDKELAKHVIRVGAGPMGMTVKAPDAETLDAYLKAVGK